MISRATGSFIEDFKVKLRTIRFVKALIVINTTVDVLRQCNMPKLKRIQPSSMKKKISLDYVLFNYKVITVFRVNLSVEYKWITKRPFPRLFGFSSK